MFQRSTHFIAIASTSDAFMLALRRPGGGIALSLKTDRDGQENSVRASAAVPFSQLF